MLRRAATIILLLSVSLAQTALSQYPFGKNKVIYTKRDWKVLQTEHVDIYHYPSERNLILFISPLVEETFLEYEELFDLDFHGRLPLVFYSSHYDFQQTNIIPSLISEYTGGFTDLVKGRIAIPFMGSIGDLRHVIRHEMVHAFMLEKLSQVMKDHHKFTYTQPPLWFIEGLAEYIASPEADTRAHMFVRDALINAMLPDLKNIWRIEGTFMMYKEGEAVVRYIATNFGRKAVFQILENWWRSDRFSSVLKMTINLNVGELSDAFMKSTKRKYYPAILHSSFASDIGERLTRPRTFHSRPAVARGYPGSGAVYSLGAKHGVINVCVISRSKGGEFVHRTLIEGGQSSAFESIPAFRSKIEIYGDTLAFVSKSRERDVVYLWDVERNRRVEAFSFPSLSMISSPTFSPDGGRIVFSAIDTTGTMDLYMYHMKEDRLERLTHDPFNEEDPDFHPKEDLILFSSDRCRGGERERYGIYRMDLHTGAIVPLTCGGRSDTNPDWSPGGESFLFSSDRDGTQNIYLYRDGVVSKQTNVLGGVTAPAFLPSGSGFVASVYAKGEFHVFLFPLKDRAFEREITLAEVDSSQTFWKDDRRKDFSFKTKNYSMKLGVDFIGTGLALDPDFGEVGNGGELVLTDVLGNHQFYIFFGNSSEGFDEFWKRLNVGISYINLARRLNYSLGIFHLTTLLGDYFTLFRSERRYGLALGVRYPFSKFSRLEGSFVLRAVERESDYAGYLLGSDKSTLGTTFLSYIADNTLWTVGGPLKGVRYYLTVGHTFDFRGRGFENTSLHFDLRRYFKLSDRVLIAERLINRNSWGSDLQLFYLGGPWDLRGYDFRRFAGRSIYLLNSEIRFPLIDRFSLSFPFGTLETPAMRGAVFFDVGRVERFIEETGWLGSFGAGAEINLGFAPVIRVNFTRTTDFDSISGDTEMELFIGYNY